MVTEIDTTKSTDWLSANASMVRFTLDQYHQMIATGFVREGAPIEFIDGFLVLKDRSKRGSSPMTVYPPHAFSVHQIARLNALVEPLGLHVRSQQPVTIPPNHEPEPDGVFVRGRAVEYDERHPHPSDITCVVEVADSSLDYDRTTKQRVYASAGIPQYVIIDLPETSVEVYAGPHGEPARYPPPIRLTQSDRVHFNLGDGRTLEVECATLLPTPDATRAVH